MRLARMQTPTGIVNGQFEGERLVTDNGVYEPGRDGSLISPTSPSAVYCVGRNFTATLEQMDYDHPDEPDFFIKPPVAVTGHEQPIYYPAWTDELTYAGELVAIVDQRCRKVEPKAVPEIVRGYTIMNDVDALDQQGRTARKAFDSSGPLGPWIETELDPRDIDMETNINGETRQSATTKQMLFDPYDIISFLSYRFTLYPGDAIAFGSPANPGTVDVGDTINITYEGIGTLSNTVVAGDKNEHQL